MLHVPPHPVRSILRNAPVQLLEWVIMWTHALTFCIIKITLPACHR